jgi:hypothetical protein
MTSARNGRTSAELSRSAGRVALLAEVVEILAGAVVELLLRQKLCPSPDGVHSSLKSAISSQIRGSL